VALLWMSVFSMGSARSMSSFMCSITKRTLMSPRGGE
jgi:hypothetical protein